MTNSAAATEINPQTALLARLAGECKNVFDVCKFLNSLNYEDQADIDPSSIPHWGSRPTFVEGDTDTSAVSWSAEHKVVPHGTRKVWASPTRQVIEIIYHVVKR